MPCLGCEVPARTVMLFQPSKKVIVCLMRTDPDPIKIVSKTPGNGTIGTANGHRPDFSFGLKLQRRMIRILFEEAIFFSGQLLNLVGQVSEEFSKTKCQERAQRCHLALWVVSC